MLLMIDNYDSFTYNLVQYLGELGEEVRTVRNDEITLDEIEALAPERIVHLARARHAGRGRHLARRASGGSPGKVPILGVCLGHQAIGAAVRRQGGARPAGHARQGRPARAYRRRACSRACRARYQVIRYHSLVIERDIAARLPRGDRLDRRRRDHGRAAQGSCRSRACSSIRNRSSANTATDLLANFLKRMRHADHTTGSASAHASSTARSSTTRCCT